MGVCVGKVFYLEAVHTEEWGGAWATVGVLGGSQGSPQQGEWDTLFFAW